MARELKRVDFYEEPQKKEDTKEDRRKYFIIGISFLGLVGIILFLILK